MMSSAGQTKSWSAATESPLHLAWQARGSLDREQLVLQRAEQLQGRVSVLEAEVVRARGDSADAAMAEAAGLQHRLQVAELAWLREKQQLNDELGRSKVTCSVTKNLIYLTPPELTV